MVTESWEFQDNQIYSHARHYDFELVGILHANPEYTWDLYDHDGDGFVADGTEATIEAAQTRCDEVAVAWTLIRLAHRLKRYSDFVDLANAPIFQEYVRASEAKISADDFYFALNSVRAPSAQIYEAAEACHDADRRFLKARAAVHGRV